MKNSIEALSLSLTNLSPQEGLKLISKKFPDGARFSSAFGQEDQVIAHMLGRYQIPIEVFTLDTGRLFPETYELIDSTRIRYNLKISIYYPKAEAVQTLTTEKGMHSFYDSVGNRKECCFIRKIEPLKRALTGAKVWVTGLRADQSDNRQHFDLVEWDEPNQIIKYNPLLHWSDEEMKDYLKVHKVPYNKLHDKGYPSIGCAPCTRAIEQGEEARAGRWWWENSKKECGLHQTIINQ